MRKLNNDFFKPCVQDQQQGFFICLENTGGVIS